MTTPVMHHPLLMVSLSLYSLGMLVFGVGLLRARKGRAIRIHHQELDPHS